jgi:putative ABC transport system permease protein
LSIAEIVRPVETPTAGKPALSWGTAARIALRELRASFGKFLFVILSVAIGVAALTGVRGLSEAFSRTLNSQARSIMAADLSARLFRQLTPKEVQQLDSLRTQGLERTDATELVSMASSANDPVPLLVSLKAVDPAAYPFYGTVVLNPAGDFRTALNDHTTVVGEDLLYRLHLHIGDTLKIGKSTFTIAASLVKEPDRMSSSMGLGPRVFITRDALQQSGLLQKGSRAGERFLFKLLPNGPSVARVHSRVEAILPEAQITDFRQANPGLTRGLDQATGILSMICLVAMVLGAIGVAMAMRAHLAQRMDILAVMKSIGAKSSDILRIYLLQTTLLGLAGGLLGALLGFGVEWALPHFLGMLLPIKITTYIPYRAGLAGLLTGLLTTLLFCLPPLLDIRNVKPSLVFRRLVEEGSSVKRTWAETFREKRAQWIAIVLILIGLFGIAAALSDSWLVGRWFTISLVVILLFILGLTAVLLRSLRFLLDKTRLSLPSFLRHGLANLYRPGNQSNAVLSALGVGVMLILTVFLMQRSMINDMKMTLGSGVPNVFMIDISTEELPGVQKLLESQPGVVGHVEALPIISGRLAQLDGVDASTKKDEKHFPRHLLQSTLLTWSDQVPAGAKVVSGKWWDSSAHRQVAVDDELAKRLHLKLGSSVSFAVNDQTIPTTVAAFFRNDGQHVNARSEFVLSRDALQSAPTVWYGAVHIIPRMVGQAQAAIFSAYPTITVINIADVVETIQGVVQQITIVIRFLAGFSILAGMVILASSVASTRYRRIREVVVLKTLGAKRLRIAGIFAVEFLMLGSLAGLVGTIFANLLTIQLLHRMDVTFHASWLGNVLGVGGTALLAVATGWLASARILEQRPLEILREE